MFMLVCTTWCCHVAKKIIQLSPAKPFSNSRSFFLIFANWRLRGVLDPRKHNSAPLSIANDTLVLIHDNNNNNNNNNNNESNHNTNHNCSYAITIAIILLIIL